MNPFKWLFRPNFGLIATVAILGFLFSGSLFPKNLDCQTVNCAKASEVVKSDQFWQENKDKFTSNFQKNFQPKTSEINFSLPWTSQNLEAEKIETDNSSENSEQKVDTGQKTEDIAKIKQDQNIYETKKQDYHEKVLFLLENLNLEKQKKLCQLNFNFISTTQTEAKIQLICQKINTQNVQGIVENNSNKTKSEVFVIPADFLEEIKN